VNDICAFDLSDVKFEAKAFSEVAESAMWTGLGAIRRTAPAYTDDKPCPVG
jgi:hypothetical protein